MFELIAIRWDGNYLINMNGTEAVLLPSDPGFSLAKEMANENLNLPFIEAPITANITPQLTRRQLRLGLLKLGISTTQIESIINQLPEPDKSIALIEWQDASVYDRNHPLVTQIGSELNLTEEKLNDAWLLASSL